MHYQDEKNEVVFCIDGCIYFKSKGGKYREAKEFLQILESKMALKATALLTGVKSSELLKSAKFIQKLKTMDYKSASNLYLDDQKKKRKSGKLFEGEFNGK